MRSLNFILIAVLFYGSVRAADSRFTPSPELGDLIQTLAEDMQRRFVAEADKLASRPPKGTAILAVAFFDSGKRLQTRSVGSEDKAIQALVRKVVSETKIPEKISDELAEQLTKVKDLQLTFFFK